jgi:hypothetical protein
MEQLKDQYESFEKMVLKEYQKGNLVFMGIEGPMVAPMDKLLEQPADGILYDLNRDEVTVLTMIKDKKWVNDYACAKVIRELKRRLTELELKYNELIKGDIK